MDFFNLPARTKVGRVIPKNAFDKYTNTKQKKLFSDYIHRVTWANKLSEETLNLNAGDIKEIQVFRVELKGRYDMTKILDIINGSIPYNIVFWVEYQEEAFISTALKHPHPTNNDIAVIDWTFISDWFNKNENYFSFNLRGNIDAVFKDMCVQISGKPDLSTKTIEEIQREHQEIDQLKKEIIKLKKAITNSRQFNEKVELNLRLKEIEKSLNELYSR